MPSTEGASVSRAARGRRAESGGTYRPVHAGEGSARRDVAAGPVQAALTYARRSSASTSRSNSPEKRAILLRMNARVLDGRSF
jgi:hypothetical protein